MGSSCAFATENSRTNSKLSIEFRLRMQEKTLILACFGGFSIQTAKVLIIPPQKNVLKNIWLSVKQLLAHDFAVEKNNLQDGKNEVNDHEKSHVGACTGAIFQNYKEHIRTVRYKLYNHGKQVQLNKYIRLIKFIQVSVNQACTEHKKHECLIKKGRSVFQY